jgi:hypothetical protein
MVCSLWCAILPLICRAEEDGRPHIFLLSQWKQMGKKTHIPYTSTKLLLQD